MRALLQRVTSASVTVDAQVVGRIDAGLCILLGIGPEDTPAHAEQFARKIINLRIFNDEAGKFNRSLLDVQGNALVVSQFTLYADTRQGRRPSFTQAAPPALANDLYLHFVQSLKNMGVPQVATGVFGAHMLVQIHNDGPVTLWLDSAEMKPTLDPIR